jgi:hypothetical protein
LHFILNPELAVEFQKDAKGTLLRLSRVHHQYIGYDLMEFPDKFLALKRLDYDLEKINSLIEESPNFQTFVERLIDYHLEKIQTNPKTCSIGNLEAIARIRGSCQLDLKECERTRIAKEVNFKHNLNMFDELGIPSFFLDSVGGEYFEIPHEQFIVVRSDIGKCHLAYWTTAGLRVKNIDLHAKQGYIMWMDKEIGSGEINLETIQKIKKVDDFISFEEFPPHGQIDPTNMMLLFSKGNRMHITSGLAPDHQFCLILVYQESKTEIKFNCARYDPSIDRFEMLDKQVQSREQVIVGINALKRQLESL